MVSGTHVSVKLTELRYCYNYMAFGIVFDSTYEYNKPVNVYVLVVSFLQ